MNEWRRRALHSSAWREDLGGQQEGAQEGSDQPQGHHDRQRGHGRELRRPRPRRLRVGPRRHLRRGVRRHQKGVQIPRRRQRERQVPRGLEPLLQRHARHRPLQPLHAGVHRRHGQRQPQPHQLFFFFLLQTPAMEARRHAARRKIDRRFPAIYFVDPIAYTTTTTRATDA